MDVLELIKKAEGLSLDAYLCPAGIPTIGYGHITCVTDTGKIATMLYAVVGIPMMFLCMANVGSSMAYFFRFIYSRICCSYCNYVKTYFTKINQLIVKIIYI